MQAARALSTNLPLFGQNEEMLAKALECHDYLAKKGIWKKVIDDATAYQHGLEEASPLYRKGTHSPLIFIWKDLPKVEQK
mmetsp:Transcript_25542/g.34144  ORF Transcript_25542/g.34144 Transcript_25542/m.34144 type:complete len:80 (+) Transcript_25542:337-576(+)|eukprot:CAMPEP_0185591048 /NCGR_PEP_ID=MMETSP0434-20130131/63203_1 /TAXON_ID=626734 ORGANISM="Favella taraikaensis, Strain Fe Narragansett Bay" /NCGR_SAMPLE_ID=MMETSP0434 /ASSEMBLY_ACC=CAM_ASM_000379 /LENGTH=79 /DNA_ID=CAMNT_0028215771 /DNA_START=198 /DNA_END=437 /DNA_ORIENTATION=-